MLLMLTAPLGKTSSLCYHGTIHSKHPYVTNTLSSLIESLTKKSVNSTDTDDNNMNTGHQKPPNKTNPEDEDDDDNDSTVVCNKRYYDNKDCNIDDTASCNFVHQD